MTARARNLAVAAASALMVALIAALALTGTPPGLPPLQFQGHGIVPGAPAQVIAVEIRTRQNRIGLRRDPGKSWNFDAPNAPAVPTDIASHVDLGLQFLHVSDPTRTLNPGEYQGSSFADFGLDPPSYVVSLQKVDGSATIADFGVLNPAGTAQYLRIVGQPTLYMMPRHVGSEWELTADMSKRLLPSETESSADGTQRLANLLLPASIDRIWAVEIVFEGKLHRFERDSAGNWLLHTGQHTHSGNSDIHVADPAQASLIAAALVGLDRTQVETVAARDPTATDLDRYGLSRPGLIALMYARDNPTPVARLAFGNMSGDGFGRYARLADGDVVTIAAFKAAALTDLLKAVGAAS